MYKFPQGTKLTIEVVFPGQYRIGWEYDNYEYVPGKGSYYDFDAALERALQHFSQMVTLGIVKLQQ